MTTIVWFGMFALLYGTTLSLAVGTSGGNAKGADCVFPFKYRGKTYNSCTKTNHNVLWCATTSDYEADKKWGNCIQGTIKCIRDYKKIGCFKGTTKMTLLISDRDGKGIQLNWKDLSGSLHSLACRCSKKAKEEGYQYFVLRFWAECWASLSHATLDANVKNPSMASTECWPCKITDKKECVGKAGTEFAYSIAHWSGWKEWGTCSEPCGGGKRQRRRACNKIDNVVNECKGVGSEEENCNKDECPTCDWRDQIMASGSAKDTIADVSSKKECLSKCLWKRLSQPAIDGVNYFASSPPECQCIRGALYVSSNKLVTYCKLKVGGFMRWH